MEIIPIDQKTANRFVEAYHRHNKRVRGYKFAVGLMEGNELIGVGIAGRPVARMLDNGSTIEILRVCVKEGYPNANSKLYGRLKRIAQLMGYMKIITYTKKDECQSSLKAVGATPVAEVKPRAWKYTGQHREHQKIYEEAKIRWEL